MNIGTCPCVYIYPIRVARTLQAIDVFALLLPPLPLHPARSGDRTSRFIRFFPTTGDRYPADRAVGQYDLSLYGPLNFVIRSNAIGIIGGSVCRLPRCDRILTVTKTKKKKKKRVKTYTIYYCDFKNAQRHLGVPEIYNKSVVPARRTRTRNIVQYYYLGSDLCVVVFKKKKKRNIVVLSVRTARYDKII